jgi:hypothetical protein
MNERGLFTPREAIRDDQVLAETEFWAWLKERADQGEGVFTLDLVAFLREQGFSMDLHHLSREQLTAHKMVHSHFWWRRVRNLD